jgi:hypothetical protein
MAAVEPIVTISTVLAKNVPLVLMVKVFLIPEIFAAFGAPHLVWMEETFYLFLMLPSTRKQQITEHYQ